MPLKVPVVGRQPLLNYLKSAFGDTTGLRIHLFKSNYTPVNGSILNDFQAPNEADFGGYASILIPNASWSAAGLDGANRAVTSAPLQTFTQDGGASTNPIYGYYITDPGSTILLWAERDPAAPTTIDASQRVYAVIPKLTLTTEF